MQKQARRATVRSGVYQEIVFTGDRPFLPLPARFGSYSVRSKNEPKGFARHLALSTFLIALAASLHCLPFCLSLICRIFIESEFFYLLLFINSLFCLYFCNYRVSLDTRTYEILNTLMLELLRNEKVHFSPGKWFFFTSQGISLFI